MKKLSLTIGSLLLIFAAQAQEMPAALSMAEAIAFAKTENAALKAKSLAVQVAKSGTAIARARYLPQIYADANLQRNLIIPITPVPANAFDNTAAEGQIIPVRFMTQWTGNAGINLTYDLFNPEKQLDIRQSKIQEEIDQAEAELARSSKDYEIKNSYVASLIAQEQYRLALADTLTKGKILSMSQDLFQEERLSQAQLNAVIADKNNSIAQLQEASSIQDQAFATFNYQLGIEPDQSRKIVLTDSLPTLFERYQQSPPTSESRGLNTQLKDLELQLNTVAIARFKKTFLPRVGLSAFYGANYYDNGFELFKGKNWNGNSFLALNLRFPIFEDQEQHKKINQLRLQNQITELNFRDELHKNSLDQITARLDAKNYQSKISVAQANLLLADQNFKIAQQQFSEGRLIIAELYDVNYAYQKAKNTYLQAAYQFISAQIKLESLLNP